MHKDVLSPMYIVFVRKTVVILYMDYPVPLQFAVLSLNEGYQIHSIKHYCVFLPFEANGCTKNKRP